jgi:hypothetical protein
MLKNPKKFKSNYNQIVFAEFYAGAVWFYFRDDCLNSEDEPTIYTLSEELFRKLFS